MSPIFSQEWVPLWTALAALAATFTAGVSAAYTYLTLHLVRAQSEPKVIVYVKHDLERPTILVIAIENIGRDIAHDVMFTSSRPVPARAWGLSPEDAQAPSVLRDGPLIDGIPALGPGDFREITWGQFGGLSKAIGDSPIVLNYAYRHGRRRLTGQVKLEVKSYVGTDASERPAATIARGIKDMDHSMGSVSRSLEQLVQIAGARDKDAV